MPKYVFDTNVLISKLSERIEAFETLYVSSIVIFERMTAAYDISEYRSYLKAYNKARKANLLFVPTIEDWLEASSISYRLAQERRAQSGGKAPRLTAKAKQEMALDVLLAVSAARQEVNVVTTNINDFLPIKRYCKNLEVTIVKMNS